MSVFYIIQTFFEENMRELVYGYNGVKLCALSPSAFVTEKNYALFEEKDVFNFIEQTDFIIDNEDWKIALINKERVALKSVDGRILFYMLQNPYFLPVNEDPVFILTPETVNSVWFLDVAKKIETQKFVEQDNFSGFFSFIQHLEALGCLNKSLRNESPKLPFFKEIFSILKNKNKQKFQLKEVSKEYIQSLKQEELNDLNFKVFVLDEEILGSFFWAIAVEKIIY